MFLNSMVATVVASMALTATASPQQRSEGQELRAAQEVRAVKEIRAIQEVRELQAVGPSSFSEQLFPQDTADGLYRAARRELNRRNYKEAAGLFEQLQDQYPSSDYVLQAMYYQAFALHRVGGDENLRRALAVLADRDRRYPDAPAGEARALRVQIQGTLARGGDAEAAARIAEQASRAAAVQDRAGAPVLAGQDQQDQRDQRDQRDQNEENTLQMQALNALMHMNAENAVPILMRILENRSSNNVELRRRAVFLIAQQRTDDRERILLDVARNDPDLEVRKHAVFHLSQVRTDGAVNALDSILQFSDDVELRERALFALSQHRSERAGEILAGLARNVDAPTELRAHAIQWMGQRRGSTEFLKQLYAELTDSELKERVLFGLSQRRSADNGQFLLSVAVNDAESIELRKKALFWLGQTRTARDQLYQMYDQVTNRELKEQLIFVYSQHRRDSTAIDKLIDLAKTESDPGLRGKAIFWLGQSRDPRAAAALEEIINREDLEQ